jgi:hypothetical protein
MGHTLKVGRMHHMVHGARMVTQHSYSELLTPYALRIR